jgi:two-component system sensor histidine kinase KdpD
MSRVTNGHAPRRGTLRIYLGAAPGVGKTFAMLNEGRRRNDRGTDVVVGYVEAHGRAKTIEQIADLEVIPRRRIEYRGVEFEEMDVDAILARHPEVALIDELAHTNVPGSRNEKRWQDVDELLDAGITVVSTVNIQHFESINDVVERITGIKQRETIPDEVVRAAEQIELVDMTAEALRRRMAHGNIYAPGKIDAALANYFRVGNLTALRELALLWVADQVDEALESYRERHGIKEPWETRERVIVAVTGAPGSDDLIRRAARIAQRTHGELVGVHVRSDTGLVVPPSELIAQRRWLLEDLGGVYREVTSGDVAAALIDTARAENATQVVLGATRRTRWQEFVQGSVVNRVIRLAGPIDVHVISGGEEYGRPSRRLPMRRWTLSPLSPRRQLWGWVVAAVGLPLLTLLLIQLRSEIGLPSVLLLYLLLAMAVALVGGVFPALAAVIGGSLLANWYFTVPYNQLTIAHPENVLALAVYVVAAGIVSVLVDRLARTRQHLARAQAETESMAAAVGSLADDKALPALVDHLRITFGMQGIALFTRGAGGWRIEAASGSNVPPGPENADIMRELNDDTALAMWGGRLGAEDQRVLAAFTVQLLTALEAKRLQAEAATARTLVQVNDLRDALLQAVSHDLRTPLAAIKASISSLRQREVVWTQDEIDDFHLTIEEATDRLITLVKDLLDMSRLQAGAVSVHIKPVTLEEVVPAAVAGISGGAGVAAVGPRSPVVIDLPESLPSVAADSALLERAVANLVENAVNASSPDTPVRIEAGHFDDRVDVRVIDRGHGIPRAVRDLVFEPFQHLTDHGTGMGLGLAIARGFIDAIGGELTIEDTPGGGVTMVISLPTAAPEALVDHGAQVGPGGKPPSGVDPIAFDGGSNR